MLGQAKMSIRVILPGAARMVALTAIPEVSPMINSALVMPGLVPRLSGPKEGVDARHKATAVRPNFCSARRTALILDDVQSFATQLDMKKDQRRAA